MFGGIIFIPILSFKKGTPEPKQIISVSLVDVDFYEHWRDFPFIGDKEGYFSLCADKSVYAKFRVNCKAIKIGIKYKLHHLVFGCTNFGNYVIDHIDGNPRNNVRSNLRLATTQQNNFNSRKPITKVETTSIYKGVCFVHTRPVGKKGVWKTWKASLVVSNKQYTKYC